MLLIVSLLISAARGAERPANADRPLRIAMYSGAAEYKSDQSLARLKEWLEKDERAKCTLNLAADDQDLPGLDQLETSDVAVIFTRRIKLPPEKLAKVRKYMDSGKPVVGIRTASHAIQTWLEFDHEVLGGDYTGHAADKIARMSISPEAKDHSVLAGVQPFTTTGKLYTNAHPAKDITVLLTATTDDNTQPVAWVRTRADHHDQRIFYTSLGTPEDFQNVNFRRLLTNAVFWAAGSQQATTSHRAPK
jgi:type 1 glutamine amidotransferase